MDNIDSSVSNIDASSKVLLKSVVQKLLPSLSAAPESLDWNEIVVSGLLSVFDLLILLFRIITPLYLNSLTIYG